MNLFDSDFWNEILHSILSHKWRSIMTSFGVVWGVFMIVMLIGTGKGLNNGIIGSVQQLPINSFLIYIGETSVPYHGFPRGRIWNMDNVDKDIIAMTLGDKLKYIASVKVAATTERDRKEIPVNSVSQQAFAIVAGVTPMYYHAMPHRIIQGRYVNEIDIQDERKVCVIGDNIAKQLFPEEDEYLGRQVKVNNVTYEVVGVCKNPNKMFDIGLDPSKSVVLPLTTMQTAWNMQNQIDLNCIIMNDEYLSSDYIAPITRLVKERHNIAPDDKTGLNVWDNAFFRDMYGNLFRGINILIWIVGLGTLLAGFIGISNIMLVTVNATTKEIGIRRALGAKPKMIVSIIVFESLTLTLISGLAGICLGSFGMYLMNSFVAKGSMDSGMFTNPYAPLWAIAVSFLILVFGGAGAGLIPARRAIKIKAIEALQED